MAEIVNFSEQNIDKIKEGTAEVNAEVLATQDDELLRPSETDTSPVEAEGASDEDTTVHKSAFSIQQEPSEDEPTTVHKSAFSIQQEPSEDEPTPYEKDLQDLVLFMHMPFVDVITQANAVARSKKDLESAKEMMDQLGMASGSHAAEIAQSNFLDRATTFSGKSAEEFYAQYPKLIEESSRVAALLKEVLNTYGTEVQSTAFTSNSMVESAQMRIRELEKGTAKIDDINANWKLKRNKVTIKAFGDRTDFEPLFVKLQYPNNVLEALKDFTADGPDNAMEYVNRLFLTVFNDALANRFRQCISHILRGEDHEATDQDRVDDFFFTYWLCTNYYKEEKTGKHSYVKTFVMNVYDINSGIYDLPGGVELFKTTIQTMYLLIKMIQSEAGPIKSKNRNYQPKYAELMATYYAMRDNIVAHAETPVFNGSSLSAMYPDITAATIADKLQEQREKEALEQEIAEATQEAAERDDRDAEDIESEDDIVLADSDAGEDLSESSDESSDSAPSISN